MGGLSREIAAAGYINERATRGNEAAACGLLERGAGMPG